jgi:hypothetical protein
MTLQSKVRFIQSICWIGVAADAIWAIALLHPWLYGMLTGRSDFQPDLTLRLCMGVGASLMAGWTFLLAWTAKEPIQRRGVLLITAFPALAGLSVVALIGSLNGNSASGWILGKCTLLSLAMLSAYHIANTIAREQYK